MSNGWAWEDYERELRDWKDEAATMCFEMIGAQEWIAEHPESDPAAAWQRYAPRLIEWAARRPTYRP